ncbi:MAG: aspartate 1-decarboxylase [Candidatus Margulisiibacteriota bacterium]
MLLTILKSKLHMATVTSCELYYQGSIAIDPKLLKAVGILPNEKVTVLNFDNGQRFETYAIKGRAEEVGLRGPAAKLGKKGDRVIILSYALMTPAEAKKFKPRIAILHGKNRIR